jgi:hypothetical protein
VGADVEGKVAGPKQIGIEALHASELARIAVVHPQ